MKPLGLLISFLALSIFVLAPLTAQDEKKKDAEKNEKKDLEKKDDKKDPEKKDEKKDPEKKDEKKDPEKKDEKKDSEKKDDDKKKPEPKKAPEKLVFASKMVTKVMSAGAGGSNSEFTVEMKELDPKKVYEVQNWKAQRQNQLTQEQYNIAKQKDAVQRNLQSMNYARSVATFQTELAQKQQNVYNIKPYDVRAVEDVKVRAMFPPVEFDDQGFQKKWTKKELEARRDKTGLPGFAVDLDALKPGQTVELYMAKQTPQKKDAPMKKKNAEDDAPPAASNRPEVVMIVILQEATPGK